MKLRLGVEVKVGKLDDTAFSSLQNVVWLNKVNHFLIFYLDG